MFVIIFLYFAFVFIIQTLVLILFRLCDLQPADIIIDPMCGTGAIPIEVL